VRCPAVQDSSACRGMLRAQRGELIVQGAPVSMGREGRITEAGVYRFFAGWRSDPFFFDTAGALNNLQFTGNSSIVKCGSSEMRRAMPPFYNGATRHGMTRHPTDAWFAQQLREATPFGQTPRFFIRDNDAKFGPLFAPVASSSGIRVLKTPFHAPRANAYCERFLRSVRRECLDHLLILHEQQLSRVLQAYVAYFNRARPHQGLQQQIPDPPASALRDDARDEPILAVPDLGGLHHDYQRVA
jgi:Integrase core domain